MKINLATAEGQQAWLDYHNPKPKGYRLPWGAGPADFWLAIVNDGEAPLACRMAAAKELRFLGLREVRAAQERMAQMWEEEANLEHS